MLLLLTVLGSLNLPYIAGGVPHAVTAEGQVIFTIHHSRGGEPTLVVGETTILNYGSGPNEGLPLAVNYDEMSRTAIIQGMVRHYQLTLLSKVRSEADYELERIKRQGRRKILQMKFGLGEISRLMTDSFEWFYDDRRSEQMIYKMDSAKINIISFPFTGTQAFVIVDNHTKEAIVFKPGEGTAKVPLDPFDQFPIHFRFSGTDSYNKGFSFIYKGREYYAVTSNIGHLVVFSINGKVIRTKTLINPENGKVHLSLEKDLEYAQAIGVFEDTLVLADFDDAMFRYFPVSELLEPAKEKSP